MWWHVDGDLTGNSYGQGALAPAEENTWQISKSVINVDGDDEEHNVDGHHEKQCGGMLTSDLTGSHSYGQGH